VHRSMRFCVLGHAVLEQAMKPWPGITCKALFAARDADPDAAASAWLARLPPDATPGVMTSVPIFGYPGWFAENERAAFYEDTRYFRTSPGTTYA
jgi:hypothetical protein